jgi:hypothetical protein
MNPKWPLEALVRMINWFHSDAREFVSFLTARPECNAVFLCY